MKLSQIRDVLAVVDNGSLRSASRKLGITQPTMTRSIRDIEHELGVVLFTRHANGVTPTEAGRTFIRRATAIQSEIRRINDDLNQARGDFGGQVSIATIFSTGLALIPSALPSFQKRFPHGRLKITESLYQPIEIDIISGEIDFFVGPLYGKPTNTLLVVEKLFDNQRVIVARKGHPLLSAKSIEDLQHSKWVRTSLSDRPDESDVENLFTRAGLGAPKVVLQTRSAILTLLAVIESDLLSLMPSQCLDFAATANCIDTINIERFFPGAPICMVRRGDVPLTPMAEAFWDMVHKAGKNYNRRLRGQQ